MSVVGLGQVVRLGCRRAQAAAEEEVAVGGDVLGGGLCGAESPSGGERIGRTWRNDLQKPLQRAVVLADASEGELHALQPHRAGQAARGLVP